MHSHAKLGNIKQHSHELPFVLSVGITLGWCLQKLSDVAIASLCGVTSPNTLWYGPCCVSSTIVPAASPAGPHIQQGHLGMLLVEVVCVILQTEHPKVLSMLTAQVKPLLCTPMHSQ